MTTTDCPGQIIRPTCITRDMVRSQPETLFTFGDNMQRTGLGGQARAMRGEPNAIGIPTKWAPHNLPDAFFTDQDWDRPDVRDAIHSAFIQLATALNSGRTIAIPADGIGTGLGQLPLRAPRIATIIARYIHRLEAIAAENTASIRIPRILNKKTDRIPPDAIYCGRPSPFGNPFIIGRDGTRDDVCDKFAAWLPTQPKLMAMIPGLAGHDLVCHCAPARCHCDTLLPLANPHLFPAE